MRDRTAPLHRRAEQSGVVGAMIAGHSNRVAYALFLRNLLPAYLALEEGLARFDPASPMNALLRRELCRAAAIERDVTRLSGEDWAERLPLLRQGRDYGERIIAAAEGDGSRLIGHAYTRYLGDLGGGPILKRRLTATLDLDPSFLSFYDFPEIDDLSQFARGYRAAIDAAGAAASDFDAVVAEAVVAFQLNIALSDAVQTLHPGSASTAGE